MAERGGVSRRVWLAGAAAAAAPMAAPGLLRTAWADPADDLAPLRNRDILPVPDFTVPLGPKNMAARVRPHRTSGLKLCTDPVVETPRGPRFIVHNYGHSGAGITLSWGSAGKTVKLVEDVMRQMGASAPRASIAVLGVGVIGLTAAFELRRRYPSVPITVYAKDLDVTKTTSYVAGGQFEPSQVWHLYDHNAEEQAKLGELLLGTRDWIGRTMASGRRLDYGLAERRNYMLELHEKNGLDYAFARGALACTSAADAACQSAMRNCGYNRGLLPFDALRTQPGREYFTWLINPRILLPRLMLELGARNVSFERRPFSDKQQVLDLDQQIIVNCTGYGARKLFCDPDLVPRRGHVVVIPNPAPDRMRYFFSGGCSNQVIAYVFARQSDIVVGGTIDFAGTDERDSEAEFDGEDRRICEQLMKNAKGLFRDGQTSCLDRTMQVAALFSSPEDRQASFSGQCAR